MKKLNREAFAKYASRFFLVLMSFLLILSLCSATAPSVSVPLLIQNPDNIPQDYSFLTGDDGQTSLEFGTNYVDAFYVGVVNGLIDDVAVDIPDGDYLGFAIRITQSYGYSNSLLFSGELFEFEGIPVYLSDSPSVTVIDGNPVDVPPIVMFFVPYNVTDSLTSVWTSITNWVISSLNTVQGVFIEGGIEYIEETVPALNINYNDNTYTIIDAPKFFSYRYLWYDGNRIDSMSTLTQSNIVVAGDISVMAYSFEGTVLAFTDGNVYWAIDNGLLGVSNTPNPNSLTLLGTLTVIGLSISLAFLVFGVISRFLKLRG